jgi:hypothetical protein
MKKVLFSLLFVFAAAFCFAQSPAKAVFVELGGPGLASVNYDMRFTGKEDGIGGRVGIGGFSIDNTTALFVPVGVNYLIGKDQKNYFELGVGFTYVSLKDKYQDPYNGTSNSDVFNGSFGHLNFGYRLQPAKGGFFFRAAITPIFGNGVFFPYYGGVSFGYKF